MKKTTLSIQVAHCTAPDIMQVRFRGQKQEILCIDIIRITKSSQIKREQENKNEEQNKEQKYFGVNPVQSHIHHRNHHIK